MRGYERNFNKDGHRKGFGLYAARRLPFGGAEKRELSHRDRVSRARHERLVKGCAGKIGLKLKMKRVNELELFCEVCRGAKAICYLCKGWDSSVLQVGDAVSISRLGGDFKERFYRIYDICSTDFIRILFPPVKMWPEAEAVLEMGIYVEGFNEDVLAKVLDTFERCRVKIGPLLKSKGDGLQRA